MRRRGCAAEGRVVERRGRGGKSRRGPASGAVDGRGHLRTIRALPRDYRAAGPVRVRLKTDDVFQFPGKGVEAVLFGVKLDGGEKSRLGPQWKLLDSL